MAATPSERAYLCARGAKAARHVAVPHGFGQVGTWRRLAVQNSRQRIEFWGWVEVADINPVYLPAVFIPLRLGVLGWSFKIRAFGGSFAPEALRRPKPLRCGHRPKTNSGR